MKASPLVKETGITSSSEATRFVWGQAFAPKGTRHGIDATGGEYNSSTPEHFGKMLCSLLVRLCGSHFFAKFQERVTQTEIGRLSLVVRKGKLGRSRRGATPH